MNAYMTLQLTNSSFRQPLTTSHENTLDGSNPTCSDAGDINQTLAGEANMYSSISLAQSCLEDAYLISRMSLHGANTKQAFLGNEHTAIEGSGQYQL